MKWNLLRHARSWHAACHHNFNLSFDHGKKALALQFYCNRTHQLLPLERVGAVELLAGLVHSYFAEVLEDVGVICWGRQHSTVLLVLLGRC